MLDVKVGKMARKKSSKKPVDDKLNEALGIAPTKDLALPSSPSSHNPQSVAEPVEAEVVDADIVVRKDADIVVRKEEPLVLGYPIPGENPDIDADYKETRQQLQDVRERAAEALDTMKDIAEQGCTAREFEVVGQLVKMGLEAAKAQIELHKDMKELREPGKGSRGKTSHIGDVNNSVYVGTTDDLLRLNKAGKLPKVADEESQ